MVGILGLCSEKTCDHCESRSFSSHERAKNWAYDLNDLTPREVIKGSHKKYWFLCSECRHSYEQSLNSINTRNIGCPYCSSSKLCANECKYCYDRSFESHYRSKDWAYNLNDKTPREVTKGSHKKYWFRCSECHHQYEQSLNNITTHNNRCPYCTDQRLCGDEECDMCREKSFEMSPFAEFWSDKNDVPPRLVFIGSVKKYWFDCNTCKHSFQKIILNVKVSFCPFCSDRTFLCGSSACLFCLPKCFASHKFIYRWSEKNVTSPFLVALFSREKIILNCEVCGHEYQQAAGCISSGQGCPYCSATKGKLCDNDNCQFCFDKSFKSHPRAKYLYDNIDLRTLPLHSHKRCNFKCEEDHIFNATLIDISYGMWCPRCKNKTEKMVYEYLKQYFPDLICEARFDWCQAVGQE